MTVIVEIDHFEVIKLQLFGTHVLRIGEVHMLLDMVSFVVLIFKMQMRLVFMGSRLILALILIRIDSGRGVGVWIVKFGQFVLLLINGGIDAGHLSAALTSAELDASRPKFSTATVMEY